MQSNYYWSGTTYANNTDNAWNVNMNNGNVNNNNKTNNNYVWPVRGDNDALRLFSFENIYRKYIKCRKNKRNTVNALKFEINCEENLVDLKEELDTGSYYPSRSVCFMAVKPKLREIFAADFKDRIVHHILVDYLEKIWEPKFIHDSYACRKNKGIHAGVTRLRSFVRQVTKNGSKTAFYMQLDIKNYFMSIDKQILFDLIAAKVKDERVLNLASKLIFHDCTKDYVLNGDRDYIKKIASHKSLFFTEGKMGLPIGNLTSQFFANVYLNELDRFVKYKLKCRYYLRYCDDFVMLSNSREELLKWKDEIRTFIAERLRLSLNKKRQSLRPVTNGINFLGYIVRKDYMLVRRRVVNNFREKLSYFEKRLVTNDNPPYVRVIYDYALLEELRATLASYFGHFKWANTFNLKKSLLKRYSFLEWFFTIEGKKIIPKYKMPARIPTLKLQYRYFKTKFAGDVIFFKKGKYYEFFEDDKETALKLGLKKMNRHSDRNTKYGFPIWLEKSFSARILRTGRSLTVITEGEGYLTGIKERFPKYRLVPQTG